LTADLKEQQTIREYLLGHATPEDSSRLEEQLLTDDALFAELLIIEDELSDQYVRDELSQPERQRFESRYLSAPERQQKLRFARALHKYVNSAGVSALHLAPEEFSIDSRSPVKRAAKKSFFSFLSPVSPAVSYALAAAVVLLVGGVSWLLLHDWRQQATLQPGNTYVVTLTPGLVRDGGETKKITAPPGTEMLRLRLELPGDEYESFRAALLNEDRTEVWTREGLRPGTSGNLIDFDVPAKLVPPGDYQVQVSGRLTNGNVEELSAFRFRIIN
jgi:hypothetical protein